MTDNRKTVAPLTRKDIEAKIVALAWQDDEFRRKFVADPKGQLEERLARKLPTSLKMTVHEEDENSQHFVIPQNQKANDAELSDEYLEQISGGTAGFAVMATFALVSGADLGVASGW